MAYIGIDAKKDIRLNATSDLDLTSDSTTIKFGADDDVILTHVHNTGLLLNSTNQLQFGDSGTYIRQSSDSVLNLVADGDMVITADGVVIGASSTATVFEATGSKNDQWAGKFTNTNSGGYGVLAITAGSTANEKAFEVRKNTSDTALLIQGDGNAAFGGATAPSGAVTGLYLKGGGVTYSTSSTYRYDMVNAYFDTAWKYIGNGVATQIYQANGAILFNQASSNSSGAGASLTWSESMRIDSSGNVGIGTSNIDVSTQAGGSGYRVLQIENDEGGQINLDHNDAGTGSTLGQINFQRAGEVLAEIEGVTDGATDNAKINFRTQPDGGALTIRATIDHDGNVGINTSSPSTYVDGSSGTTLSIESSGTNRGALVFASECTGGSNEILGIINFTDTANTASNFRAAAIKGHKGSGNGDAYLTFHTDNTERMRILSNGDVRFGAGNSHTPLIQGTTNSGRTAGSPGYTFNNDENTGMFQPSGEADTIAFSTAGSERVRIHSGGHVSIGKDNLNAANAGVQVEVEGDTYITAEGSEGKVLYLNRLTSNGTIIDLRKDSGGGGEIGVSGGSNNEIYIYAEAGKALLINNNGLLPGTSSGGGSDNTTDLGQSDVRFDDVFATNGTIQTSDENEKQDIASATDKELNVAKKLSTLFKTFRWRDKVIEKGDKARTHTGIVAQEVKSAFEAEGLDATKYGLFISDTWTNDDGKEQTRLGVRYPELFSFIFSSIEARLTALEGK